MSAPLPGSCAPTVKPSVSSRPPYANGLCPRVCALPATHRRVTALPARLQLASAACQLGSTAAHQQNRSHEEQPPETPQLAACICCTSSSSGVSPTPKTTPIVVLLRAGDLARACTASPCALVPSQTGQAAIRRRHQRIDLDGLATPLLASR